MTFRRPRRDDMWAAHLIDHRHKPWSRALATAGGMVDAATVRGSDLRLWDDDDVVAEAASVRDTSTQRPRRSSTAA